MDKNSFLKELGRINLCCLPTPLVEAKRLSAALGGPEILIKRDDLTGLAAGGNKARALEFLIARVVSSGFDTVIAVGPQQSNWLCCLAAAAKKCGLDVVLLLLKGDNQMQGNALLYKLLGAEVRFMDIDILNIAEAEMQMEKLAEELRAKGRNPFNLAYGPVPLPGIAGYMQLASEICQQLETSKIVAQHLFVGSGSGCTQAGVILGSKLIEAKCKIHGVLLDPRYSKEQQERCVLNEITAASNVFKLDVPVTGEDIFCIDGYAEHYGTTEKGLKAIKMLAETEGIFLDPNYTGKVMAAMVDQIREGRITRGETVVFYHSGGIPAIFSHSEELAA